MRLRDRSPWVWLGLIIGVAAFVWARARGSPLTVSGLFLLGHVWLTFLIDDWLGISEEPVEEGDR